MPLDTKQKPAPLWTRVLHAVSAPVGAGASLDRTFDYFGNRKLSHSFSSGLFRIESIRPNGFVVVFGPAQIGPAHFVSLED